MRSGVQLHGLSNAREVSQVSVGVRIDQDRKLPIYAQGRRRTLDHPDNQQHLASAMRPLTSKSVQVWRECLLLYIGCKMLEHVLRDHKFPRQTPHDALPPLAMSSHHHIPQAQDTPPYAVHSGQYDREQAQPMRYAGLRGGVVAYGSSFTSSFSHQQRATAFGDHQAAYGAQHDEQAPPQCAPEERVAPTTRDAVLVPRVLPPPQDTDALLKRSSEAAGLQADTPTTSTVAHGLPPARLAMLAFVRDRKRRASAAFEDGHVPENVCGAHTCTLIQ